MKIELQDIYSVKNLVFPLKEVTPGLMNNLECFRLDFLVTSQF